MLPSQSINMKRQDSVRGENSAATLVLLINNANTSLDSREVLALSSSLFHFSLAEKTWGFHVSRQTQRKRYQYNFLTFSCDSFVDMGARSAEIFFLSIPFLYHPFSYTLLNKIYFYKYTPEFACFFL